ncbi:hypothetical protein Pst134EA_009786 [Puccinia striiformis f. sp. tritici]|uniref:hypothetical protein n=1 Tax=Puccinia striiformis f. sp. tritici TaxID=168172 RepID=UPI0020089B87|nr:hypothetical protein Pst134EA_009786 [Puccinia striiformis f. sp. tritici]KAH9469265.1 hypothetical protein Pst134EA_009786 [Puccinia striiformis f. sp. tritici]
MRSLDILNFFVANQPTIIKHFNNRERTKDIDMETELIPKDTKWKRLRKEKKIERKKLQNENKRDRDQLEAEDKQSLEQEPSQTMTGTTEEEHPSKQKSKPKSKRDLDPVDPNPQTSAGNTIETTAPSAGAGNAIPSPTEPVIKPPQEKKIERRKSKEKPWDHKHPSASSIQNNADQINQPTEPGSCPNDNPQTKERKKLRDKARDKEESTASNVAINQDELNRLTEPQSCPSVNLQTSIVPDDPAPPTETSHKSASVTAVKKKNAPRKSKETILPEEQSKLLIIANDH